MGKLKDWFNKPANDHQETIANELITVSNEKGPEGEQKMPEKEELVQEAEVMETTEGNISVERGVVVFHDE